MADVEMIRRTLEVFCQPGQVVSIQAFYGRRQGQCICTADLEQAIRFAGELDQTQPLGVYFIPNPVQDELANTQVFPKDEHILRRHWLLIDVDPWYPSGTSSSAAEKEAARRVRDSARSLLDSAGLTGAVLGDSGNGWHLCYPIDCPNDPTSKEIIHDILYALQKRCGDPLTDRENVIIKAKQFLEAPKAKIDTSCHDAKRIWKLYGTTARKGTTSPERPHRVAQFLEGPPWSPAAAQTNTERLPAVLRMLLETYEELDQFGAAYKPTPQAVSAEQVYCRKGLDEESRKVAQAVVGTRNTQLNASSFAVGQLVGPNRLTYEEAFNSIYLAALDAGCDDPRKDKKTISNGLKDGMKQPRDLGFLSSANGATPHPSQAHAGNSADPLDRDATAADLILANATIRWGWLKWMQFGVLNALASEPGIGKTRFCADLARRIFHGLPWPDGAEATFAKGSCTLWVPADNQHAELATLTQTFGFPPEYLYLNATRRNPFAGTMLDDPSDLRDFEARIRRIHPALVFIDTSLNATDRSAHKPEDAKAFFRPASADCGSYRFHSRHGHSPKRCRQTTGTSHSGSGSTRDAAGEA